MVSAGSTLGAVILPKPDVPTVAGIATMSSRRTDGRGGAAARRGREKPKLLAPSLTTADTTSLLCDLRLGQLAARGRKSGPRDGRAVSLARRLSRLFWNRRPQLPLRGRYRFPSTSLSAEEPFEACKPQRGAIASTRCGPASDDTRHTQRHWHSERGSRMHLTRATARRVRCSACTSRKSFVGETRLSPSDQVTVQLSRTAIGERLCVAAVNAPRLTNAFTPSTAW